MASEKTVFIVDDDDASAESLQALMTAEGFSVEAYHSAEDFLQGYNGSGDGCLVLDIRLEGMSGVDLQRELQSYGAPLSIIMITGYADDAVISEAKTNGAVAVLEKPFSASELCVLVREVLSKRSK